MLHVGNVQAIARRLSAVDINLDIATSGHPLGIDRRSTGNIGKDRLQLLSDGLNLLEIFSAHLDAHRRLDPGRQHIDARRNRHHPGIGYPRYPHQAVEFLLELVGGHPLSPLFPRFELNECFDHGQRRRVGSRVGPSDLAKHRVHLRYAGNQFIGLLKELPRLADRQPWISGRHVHQVAFIQGWNKLAANLADRPETHQGYRQHQGDRRLRETQYCLEYWHIDPDQQSIDRILVLRKYAAADEIAHQHRNQGDRQPGTGCHGIGLGEGQG